MYKSVYLMYEGDGTSMAAPKLVGATLNRQRALEWSEELPQGSWEYRSIKTTPLRWSEEEN